MLTFPQVIKHLQGIADKRAAIAPDAPQARTAVLDVSDFRTSHPAKKRDPKPSRGSKRKAQRPTKAKSKKSKKPVKATRTKKRKKLK